MLSDMSRAFFKGNVLPGEESMIGTPSLCLCGTRDAAMRWQECVADNLKSLGFQRNPAHPVFHYHEEMELATLVHGDDQVSMGSRSQERR